MRLRPLARATSLVALVVAGAEWRRLRRHLGWAYARYRLVLRPRLPAIAVATLVAAEDRRFYRHGGVDPRALAAALWRGRLGRTLERGSTIEHRLVRILSGRGERGLGALIRSLLLASRVASVVPKADVPGLYLSVAYFGREMNGIHRACRRLGFELEALTSLQAAALVARLRYPEPDVLSPRRARRMAARAKQVRRLAAALPAAGPAVEVVTRDHHRDRARGERPGAEGPPERLPPGGGPR